MITWLDRIARAFLTRIEEKHHGGNPRKALAYHVNQIMGLAHQGFRRGDLFDSYGVSFLPG
jgi:hypothetical protein